MKTEVADVALLISKTNSCYLFGHSFGGAVALEAVLNLPGILKLALYEPAVSIRTRLPVEKLPPVLAEMAAENYRQAFVDIMMILSEGSADREELIAMSAAIVQSPAWPQIRALIDTVPPEIKAIDETHNSYEKFKHITQPVLLMYGANSKRHTIEEMQMVADIIPGCRTEIIKNAGHNGPDIENPQEVATALQTFFCLA